MPHKFVVPNGGLHGEDCQVMGYLAVPPGADPAPFMEMPDIYLVHYGYPYCPEQPDVASADTPQTVAYHYWKEVPLPTPSPRIQPGRAITGKYAYLETRGTTSHTFNQADTPFGPLQIVATGNYYVDWGDGNRTGPYPYEGGPWRDGRIKHEYLWVGKYDVVVTERWTATWHFGADSGMLTELRTTGHIDDFPVEEIQAVIYRG